MSLPRARYRLQHYKSHFHDRPCCTQIHRVYKHTKMKNTNTPRYTARYHLFNILEVALSQNILRTISCTSYDTLSTRSTYYLNIQLTICHTFTKHTCMTRTMYCWESIQHRNIEPWELALVIPLLRNINGQGNLTPLFLCFFLLYFSDY